MTEVATRFEGPVSTVRVSLGGIDLEIVVPAEPDRLLEDPEVVALNDRDGSMPYWAQLWPGAYLLAEAVLSADWPQDTRALEIGCGLGLAGLAALSKGVRVVFTDRDRTPLAFVAESVARNGFQGRPHSIRPLDWREPTNETHDLILGADVLYENAHVPELIGLLSRSLRLQGQAWIAGPYRAALEEFDDRLDRTGCFERKTKAIETRTETGRRLEGALRILTRRR